MSKWWYSKKPQEGNSEICMIDILVEELDIETN